MGTRHLTVVVVDGIHRVAQYGQWDGYPDGQGVTVAAFLHDVLTNNRLSEFEDKVRATTWLTVEDLKARWVAAGAYPASDFVSLTVSEKFSKMYPENSRDTGAAVLQVILDRDTPVGLRDDILFGLDSLFCEYAYVVDLDAKTIEFYKGFNKDASANAPRFMALPDAQAHLDKENKDRDSAARYEAVALAGTFTFDELVQEGAQAIVDKMNALIAKDDEEGAEDAA